MNIDEDPGILGDEMDQLSELLKRTFPAKSNQDLVKLLEDWAFVHAEDKAYLQKHLESSC